MNKEHNEVQEVLRTNRRCPKCGTELRVIATYYPHSFHANCGTGYYTLSYRVKCSNSECDIRSDSFFCISELEDAWRLKILDE